MKYFLLLLSGLLVGRCSSQQCKFDRKVDIFLLLDSYAVGTECTRVPTSGHNAIIDNFKQHYIKHAITYGQTIMNYTYDWGLDRGDDLIDDAKKRSRTLETCIKSNENSNDGVTCLEYALEDLTKQFQFFLELMPGKAVVKRPPLPDLPPLLGKIQPIPELSTTDVFLDLVESLDNDLENFYNIVTNIHQEGWHVIRTYFQTMQIQFRNQILNGQVLPKYRSIAERVLKLVKSIQRDVKPELWESFQNACERIIEISEDYKEKECAVECADN